MANPITIALAQIDISFADNERNVARMIQVLEETATKGAKLTVFPEAALSGYCRSCAASCGTNSGAEHAEADECLPRIRHPRDLWPSGGRR
jgi:predicted amidohydrolase